MGAKYIPSAKDQQAARRFQQKQTLPKSPFKKPTATQPRPPAKQK
jgi:hypothetical protein